MKKIKIGYHIFFVVLLLSIISFLIFQEILFKRQLSEKEKIVSTQSSEILKYKKDEETRLNDPYSKYRQTELEGCLSNTTGTVSYTYGIKLASLEPEWHCSTNYLLINCSAEFDLSDKFNGNKKVVDDNLRPIPIYQLSSFSISLDKYDVENLDTKPTFKNPRYTSKKHIVYDFNKPQKDLMQFIFYSPNFLISFGNQAVSGVKYSYGKYIINLPIVGENTETKLITLAEKVINSYQPLYQISKNEIESQLQGYYY